MGQKRLPLRQRLEARRLETFRQGGMLKVEPVVRCDGQVTLMYRTPCCGERHYDFPGVPRTCLNCGRDHTNTPVLQEREYNMRHSRVTRYVS